jgi:hypothetical protein
MRVPTRGQIKSLAYHEVVARRLRENPALIEVARARVAWLRERNPAGTPYYDRWDRLLQGPLEPLIAAMLDPSDRGHSLRQENPFMDLVTQRERAEIHRTVIRSLEAATP